MSSRPNLLRSTILLACVVGLVTQAACASLDYHKIQDGYDAAVAADVQPLSSPNTESSQVRQQYEKIQNELTDAEIDKLDARLKPNAYAIRAVSQWRCGKLQEARESALRGQQLPNVASSPRDQMILLMIPALVIDEELVGNFKAANSTLTEAQYNATYPADFDTAAGILRSAIAAAQPSTPASVVEYAHLQRWRVLQNWRIVIAGIEREAANGADARARARADAKQRLGQDLLVAITAEEQAVPANSPLRNSMMSALRIQ